MFDQTPLYLAVENQDVKTVQLLLKKKGINVNEKSIQKKQLFLFSSRLKWFKWFFKNNKILMKFWLTRFEWNFILNYFNKILFNWLNEKTPLQAAVENENIEIISLLLKH